MTSRERVLAVLSGRIPDRIPRFEVWIDALYQELGVSDPYSAYAELGQDAVLLPSQTPVGATCGGRAWTSGGGSGAMGCT